MAADRDRNWLCVLRSRGMHRCTGGACAGRSLGAGRPLLRGRGRLRRAGASSDALTYHEIVTAAEVLRDAGRADDDTSFLSVALWEMDKAAVRAWQAGQPMDRAARVLGVRGGEAFEAIVDLGARRVRSWTELDRAAPAAGAGRLGGGQAPGEGRPRLAGSDACARLRELRVRSTATPLRLASWRPRRPAGRSASPAMTRAVRWRTRSRVRSRDCTPSSMWTKAGFSRWWTPVRYRYRITKLSPRAARAATGRG